LYLNVSLQIQGCNVIDILNVRSQKKLSKVI